MTFRLIPILEKMESLYQLPRNRERFNTYLSMLQGNSKNDMILPISGYNPMANDDVLLKLRELKSLNAEAIIEEELAKINSKLTGKKNRTIEVALNLADDIGGAWTHFYTTDYSSKFDLNALIQRNFCTPFFWTSESYSAELIACRTAEYAFRTVYQIHHGKPKSLKNRLEQEVFVSKNVLKSEKTADSKDFSKIEKFYFENQNSDDYNLNFCFFYGDEAAEKLGYPTFEMKKFTGFEYADFLERKQ